MAFSNGKSSEVSVVTKRYIGAAPVKILKVNPNKEELEQLYSTTLENAPTYLGQSAVGTDQHMVPQVRLSFVVTTDVEKTGIEMTTTINFFLNKAVRYNRDNTKVQVINKYGETTWLPVENAKAGTVPENLSWFEPADFRPAYIGEEDLTNFIKAYLCIPNKSYRNNTTGQVVEIANKADAEARLDKIEDYFKGDFTELRDITALQPNNNVVALFGVKTNNEGKQFQAVYTQKFLKGNMYRPNVITYEAFEKDVTDRKANGSYATTEFSFGNIKEYTVESTQFNEVQSTTAPEESSFPW